jgi:fused signal recognition particle receptor
MIHKTRYVQWLSPGDKAVFERLKKGIGGILSRISKTELKGDKLDKILWDFEIMLLENDVALNVADRICQHLKEQLEGVEISRFEDISDYVEKVLRESLVNILTTDSKMDLFKMAAKKKREKDPLVLIFVGINGTGKTTSIAKIAKLLSNEGYSVVLACSDTYRAGAIEQLEEHAKRLGVPIIKHRYGADSAAVAFDSISHAKARGINVVLIDTAGRMQTNRNLMDNLKKVKRIAKPDFTILVVDALTGNDAVQQAELFNKLIGFDAAVLTKVDADAKGGSSLSVVYLTGKPIIFIGTGQTYKDLIPFDTDWFVNRLFS